MKIFVTGGTGGLGQELVRRLTDAGHVAVTLTRRPPAPEGSAGTVTGDLLDPPSYAQAMAGMDAVLHLAAVTHAVDPDLYYAVNARGTEMLVRAAAEAGVRRFVFVSTRAVGAACGAYGDSKALAEDAVRASGLDWTIVRPAEVYAPPRRSAGLSGKRESPGGEAVGKIIEAVRSWPAVPFVPHRQALLAPACRDDVVAAIAAALDCAAAIGKTYVLAGPEEMTQKALVERLMRLTGRRRPAVPVPVSVLRLVAACSRLLRLRRPPFVPDQIPRLLCPKQGDSRSAMLDLGFAPRDIGQALALDTNE